MNRPRSVTIISLFYWFSTLYFGAVSIISFFLLFGPYLKGIVPLDKIFSNVTPLDYLFFSLPIVGLGIAIFLAITGWGLWRLKKWAWLNALIGSGLLVAFGLLMTIIKFFQGEVGIPYLLILHGLVLWNLLGKNVKVRFKGLPLDSHNGAEVGIDKVNEEQLSRQDTCSACGARWRAGAIFCHKCGTRREEISLSL